MRGIIATFLISIVVAMSQLAIAPFIVSFQTVGLVIPGLIFMVMNARVSRSFLYAAMVGFILDSFTLAIPTFYIFRLLILVVVTTLIFTRSLTNRSVYTAIVLSLVASTVDVVLTVLIQLVQGVPWSLAWSWYGALVSLFLHVLCSFIGFSILALFPRRWVLAARSGSNASWYG